MTSKLSEPTQSSRLAEFGGHGMSFNICRGTLGSLAMFTAIRNASSRDSSFALERRRLLEMDSQPRVSSPDHLAAFGSSPWHAKQKRRRDAKGGAHFKACTRFR
jgi:hypothetical protein